MNAQPDLTDDQLDERARRLVQIRHSEPTELTDADLEAIATAHHDGCVRMAAAELLTARAELGNARQTAQDLNRLWSDDYGRLTDERDIAREARDVAVKLLEYALHLRIHGECAPGGNETWREFDRRVEEFLRAEEKHHA